jgi:hypothetical protein
MPRDLQAEKAALEGLTKHADDAQVSSPPDNDPMPLYRMPSTLLDERFTKLKDLHPYSLLLNQEDLDDCDWLEHSAFDPHEAATREKVLYSSYPDRASPPYSPVPVLIHPELSYHLGQTSPRLRIVGCRPL